MEVTLRDHKAQASRMRSPGSTVGSSSAGSPRKSFDDAPSGKGRCCCCLLFLGVLVVLATTGGILLWQFLPDAEKQLVQDVLGSTASSADEQAEPSSVFAYNQCQPNEASCCNGVPGLCEVPIDQVLFASVHNAMATRADGFFLAPNHRLSLEEALEFGYRAINLDIGVCDGKLALIHGRCLLGERDPIEVFEHLSTFLRDNPNEVIVLSLEIVNNNPEFPVSLSDVSIAMGNLTQQLYLLEDDTRPEWPTLQQMIDINRRLLLFHYNGPFCKDLGEGWCPTGFYDYFRYVADTQFEYESIEDFANATYACEPGRGANGFGSFYGLHLYMKIPDADESQLLNDMAFVEEHVDQCETYRNGTLANFVYVDFWEQGDLVEVVQMENIQRAKEFTTRRHLLRGR